METTIKISSIPSPIPSCRSSLEKHSNFLPKRREYIINFHALSLNNSFPLHNSNWTGSNQVDVHRCRSSTNSMFSYEKTTPEEIIEKPVGLHLAERRIGDNPRCINCETKGAILCITCSGSGLYVDSILESQGIIVKVRCLGCGGTGNIMCSDCGGRGHL